MAKSADAFRTISEVADWLETPAHVLRFWESKFAQVKPVKRAGGRRYYRPTDMLLLGGIKKLLHTDGMTIKGVQKLLREHGVKHVSGHSQPLDDLTKDTDDNVAQKAVEATPAPEPAPVVEPVREEPTEHSDPAPVADPEDGDDPVPVMPSFAHRSVTPDAAAETAPPAPKPATVTVPDDPSDDVATDPGILTSISKLRAPISDDMADRLGDVLARLRNSAGGNASGQGS